MPNAWAEVVFHQHKKLSNNVSSIIVTTGNKRVKTCHEGAQTRGLSLAFGMPHNTTIAMKTTTRNVASGIGWSSTVLGLSLFRVVALIKLMLGMKERAPSENVDKCVQAHVVIVAFESRI